MTLFHRLAIPGRRALGWAGISLAILWLVGCSSTPATDPRNIAKRKAERPTAFAALTPEQQAFVDQGQIRVGMTEDAVYLAWGKPASVSMSEGSSGLSTLWQYTGTTSDDYLTWRYREIFRPDGTSYLDRFMDRDIDFRSYVAAELVFQNGLLQSWKTLPKPPGNTYFGSPGPRWY